MSKDMQRGIVVTFAFSVAMLIVGAILMGPPETLKEWVAFMLLAIAWFGIGYATGGRVGYDIARKEGKEQSEREVSYARRDDRAK